MEPAARAPLWDIWSDLLSEQDKAVIFEAGYADHGATLWNSRAVGEHPGLLIVDMQEMFFGQNLPILEVVGQSRTAMGSTAWNALNHLIPFVKEIRALGVPVFYTRLMKQGWGADDPGSKIIAQLTPQRGDVVVDKPFTSAFFGTDLLSRLEQRGVDTLIVVGTSTSGCVRAAVVDARQLGMHPIIPVECVFDRIEASHKVSLLDMWMKYATVQPAAEVLKYAARVTGFNNDD